MIHSSVLVLHLGKDKKEKADKKAAAANTTTGKDKKEGKQKSQTNKEEVSHITT